VLSVPYSLAPRLVAIAASGAIHATVFASLAFTTPKEGRRGIPETILMLEPQEDVPAPPVVAPVEPLRNEPPKPHVRPPPPKPEPTAAPDFLARFMLAAPPSPASAPAARNEDEVEGRAEGTAAPSMPETTYGEDDVGSPARLLSNVNAAYPMEAWASGVEADVPVEIVVDAQGSVVSARVVTRAGHGFDDAALASVKTYRFEAAQRDGRAVRVRVRWSIQFRLHR
jgi:protein TonB